MESEEDTIMRDEKEILERLKEFLEDQLGVVRVITSNLNHQEPIPNEPPDEEELILALNNKKVPRYDGPSVAWVSNPLHTKRK